VLEPVKVQERAPEAASALASVPGRALVRVLARALAEVPRRARAKRAQFRASHEPPDVCRSRGGLQWAPLKAPVKAQVRAL
jgi:hypothetical protein